MRISDWSSDVCSSDLIEKVRPATASNILLWIIAAFVLIFIIWASVTELDRTVRGQGRVIPSSQLQVVSNLDGGIVEAILVRTGELVKRGAGLVRLAKTGTGAGNSSPQPPCHDPPGKNP